MRTVMSPMRESPPTRHTRKQVLKMDEIMQSHEVVVADEAEKEQAINGISEALAKLQQEPDVITYGK